MYAIQHFEWGMFRNNVSPSTKSRLKKDAMRAQPVKISNNTIRKSNAYSYWVLF